MGETGLVLADDSDGVRTLVLNRPDQLNAFNQALCAALGKALLEAETDDDVRVVVITGAGRAFSAGTDLYELAENADFRGTAEDPHNFERLVDLLAGFSKPLLCAVNGLAVGLGATMLGHADLVFMADSARLKCPFTGLALAPEAGSSVTFPRLLGRQAAFWTLVSSEWIDAAEAHRMGLAWKVLPGERLLAETTHHARRLAMHPLGSLVECKRLIAAGFERAVAEGRQREDAAFTALLPSPESREAVAAFAKRQGER